MRAKLGTRCNERCSYERFALHGVTAHHADQGLFDTVKDGGQRFAPSLYRSVMPAYRDMLTDDEIWAVLAFIKSRWPPSIRAHQERENSRTR